MAANPRPSRERSGQVLASGLLLACVLLAGTAVPVHARQPDLDALVGWPFPTELTAASSAAAFAWVRNERGARNVWLATGPEWSGRRLTSFTRDDGQEVAGLAISADGTTVAFVRGGAPNRAGEIPNPESDPAGAQREIWTAAADGSGARRLGPGHSPLLTRDGSWVIHLNGGEILRRPAGDAGCGGAVAREGPGEPRGAPSVARRHVARLDQPARRPCVYRRHGAYLPERSAIWTPPWTRTGARSGRPTVAELAFVRIPNRRGPAPLLCVAGVAALEHPRRASRGRSHPERCSRPGPDPAACFRASRHPANLFWGADGRIAFPWESNGYTNLYSVRADGSESPRTVSTGHFEVQYVTLAPGRRSPRVLVQRGRHGPAAPVAGAA